MALAAGIQGDSQPVASAIPLTYSSNDAKQFSHTAPLIVAFTKRYDHLWDDRSDIRSLVSWEYRLVFLSSLADLLRQSRRPKVLVVGDVMLDSYLWGDADRISYEAPVPVLRAQQREMRLGGAGSVLMILTALEVDAIPVWVIGDDREGRSICGLVERLGVSVADVVTVAGRPTTHKERILGRTQSRHPQQLLRVDRECLEPVDGDAESELLRRAERQLRQADLVLISDYSKGVCTPGLVQRLIAEARRLDVPVLVDPGREVDYRIYAGASCMTPNRWEAARASGRTILTPDDGLAAARSLLGLGVDSVAVTLDRDGIAWAQSGGAGQVFPVRARQVYDITGAGDAVLAALGFAIAMGADWPAAIQLANLAGGVEVERLGVAAISRRDLLGELHGEGLFDDAKIVSLETLTAELDQRRVQGQRIVMTNGCFDLLHPGHVASLQYARRQGDCLVVGLNSDESVTRLKGEGRPIIGQRGRAQMLAALGCVDYVVLFPETSVAPLVERVRPDVLVKAAHYGPDEVVGGELVRSYGGQVVLAPLIDGMSTSQLVRTLQQSRDAGQTPTSAGSARRREASSEDAAR
jgi:D-beta-D-heptose 7-phosphate kinase / D-beta-D-heptose 1-phosphate adenosyltransferase